MTTTRPSVGLSLLSAIVCASAFADDGAPLVLMAERSGAAVVDFAPDGGRLVSGGSHQDISYLWDLKTGEPIAPLEGAGDLVKSAAFTPDGRLIVTAGLDTDSSSWVITAWDGRTGRKVGALPPNSGWAAAIAPEGRALAVARLGKGLDFYSLPDLRPLNRFDLPLPDTPDGVAYSPDGAFLAAWVERSAWIGDRRTDRQAAALEAGATIKSLAFGRDPKAVVTGGADGTVTCWNVATGRAVWSHDAHREQEVRGVAVSPDGRLVASGGLDGTIHLWETRTGAEVRAIDTGIGSIQALDFSKEGTKVAAGLGASIAVWALDGSEAVTPATADRPGAQSGPPADAKRFGGHAYALVAEPMTWHVARDRCEAMGGHLATFETPAERAFLQELIRAADTSAWVGATDEVEEGAWVWVTGEPVTADQREGWGLDNHENAQHSLCYWKNTGVFDDNFSGFRLPFVCEWED